MTIEEFIARHGTKKASNMLRLLAKQAWAERRSGETGDKIEVLANDLEELLKGLDTALKLGKASK